MSPLQDTPSVADAIRPMSRAWSHRLQGYAWHAQTIGCSEAEVFRLTGEGLPPLFVKSEPISPFAELPGEIDRLRWLTGQSQLAPSVEAEAEEDGRLWLLMSEVPGRDLASSPDLSPLQIAEIAADALRELHALDVALCPFDQRLAAKLAQAEANVAAGRVDEEDMDDERLGRTAASVLEEALALRPATEDLVVAHGDASMPNLMAEHGRFTGFIDCGRPGVADRHQDLALAAWSIEFNLGASFVRPFLARYGGPVDRARLHYYRLLDVLF
ncbi:APH(3') family aminoglycoside O-phosphotransferase [Sphingomonas sp.]|jgi:aminoglycoside 3'-phosphotransferase II